MRKRLHGLQADAKAAILRRSKKEPGISASGSVASSIDVTGLTQKASPESKPSEPAIEQDKGIGGEAVIDHPGHVPIWEPPGPEALGTSHGSHKEEVPATTRAGTSADETNIGRQTPEPSIEIPEVRDEWQKASDAVWKQAYERFTTDEKALSEFYEHFIGVDADKIPELDIKNQMHSVAETQRKRMEERQWSFRAWGSSKPRKIRDAIDGIFTMTKNASSLISVGMTFAPVYLSLPWSAVSALIPFLMNDTAQQKGAIQGLQNITRILYGYNMAEKTYLQHSSPNIRERYADAVIDLYVSVLIYQTKAAQYFGKNTMVNMLRNTVQLGTVWEDECAGVAHRDNEAQRNLSFLGPALVQEFFRDQTNSYELALRGLSNQRDQDDKVLRWLSPQSPFDGHFKVQKDLGQRYLASNQWALGLQEYKDWGASTDQILLLEGGVGTGKSSITFSITEDLIRHSSGQVAFFYCSKSTGIDQDLAISVLRSLIRQCAKTDDGEALKPSIREFYDDNRTRHPEKCELDLEECSEQLTELINSDEQTSLVIDALDECSDLDNLISNIRKIWDCAKGKCRIFFTSRHGYADTVLEQFHSTKLFEILDRNSLDIEEYLRLEIPSKMEGRRLGNAMTDEQAEKLREMLKIRAKGMFLWVTLQVSVFLPQDRLARPKTVGDVDSKLKSLESSAANLPESLNKVYDQIYNAALGPLDQPRRKAMVETALKWVLCSYRPITLPELAYAAAIDVDGVFNKDVESRPSILQEVCSNLLTEDASGFVRPSHLSVKEYLEHRKPIIGSVGEFASSFCHTQAAITCLHFKSLCVHGGGLIRRVLHEFSSKFNDIGDVGFPTYATTYWPRHYKDALKDDELRQILIKYLKLPRGGLERLQSLGLDQYDISPTLPNELDGPLRRAARLGWEDEVEAVIALGADLYAQNEFGDTVLHEAVDWGQPVVAEIALGNAVIRDPNLINITNRTGNSAYHRAMFWGKRGVIDIITSRSPSMTTNINLMSAIDVEAVESYDPDTTPEPRQVLDERNIVPLLLMSAPLISGRGRYIYETNDHFSSDNKTTTKRRLCKFCDLAAWLERPSVGFHYKHHNTFADLEASAISGCELCSLFIKEFGRKYYGFRDTDELSSYVSVRSSLSLVPWSSSGSRDLLTVLVGENAKVMLEFCLDRNQLQPYLKSGKTTLSLDTYFEVTKLGSVGAMLCGRSVAPSAVECFGLVRSWLKECEMTHSLCGNKQATSLPSRVLLIEDTAEGEELHVRLHTTSAERGRFVYLSHSWGGNPPMKSTMESINKLSRRFSANLLPRCWRDAVFTTRKAGFCYLWIDALCINQDSAEDWEREASRMSRYISDAAIVLAAGSGGDSEVGIFAARPEEALMQFNYIVNGPATAPDGRVLYLRRPLRETREGILHTPLARRGWTMQEAALPERLLYYAPEQLYWNCQTHARSEGSILLEVPVWKLASDLRSVATKTKSERPRLFLNTWYGLVEEYSTRLLTFSSDKLIGIASIASVFKQTGSEYAAGLWIDDIHRGLLWKVTRSGYRPENNYAPSWSWASLDGPIQYELAKGIRLPVEAQGSARILKVDANPISKLPFGPVRNGFLVIEGLVQEVAANLKSALCSYHFDTRSTRKLWEGNQSFTCVLIARWSLGMTDTGSHWIGLILLKCDDAKYQRVGLLEGPPYEEIMPGWERRKLTII